MSVRSRHLVAYASAMIFLMLWQMLFSSAALQRISDYGQDIIYTLVSQIFCMGILPFTILLILNRGKVAEPMKSMRYKVPRNGRVCFLVSIGMVLLITPFTMAFSAITNLFFRVVGYKRSQYVGTIYLGVGDLWLALLLTAILPAIFEEFSHRGLLLSGLQNRGSEMSAVILSAVMFGLMHMNPGQMVFAVFGGLVFGVAVVKCDSIIPAMCAHFGNNAISVILDYSRQRQTALGVWYDRLTSSASLLSVGLTFAVLALSIYGMVRLMQYAARKAPKPISEGKLLGFVTLDIYSPDGKATLKDNALLYATMIAEGALLAFLLIWGIIR